MKQDKFKTEREALKIAKEWAKSNSFVTVIQSKGDFFVENEHTMIRNWEREVKVYVDGNEVKQ